jgi:hypothetical protein
MCPHLLGHEEPPAHYRVLRGRGLDFDLVCEGCKEAATDGAAELVVVCEGCVERVASETSELVGWVGTPGIDVRSEPVTVVRVGILGVQDHVLASDRAVAAWTEGWMTLSSLGEVRSHVGDEAEVVGHVDLDDLLESPVSRTRQPVLALHASDDGRFVAVANDYGSTALVLALESGTTTWLERGSYHEEQTPYPCAFTRRAPDGPILVTATAWNRLDIVDPESGEMLTETGNVIDYFHGALYPSPDGRRVLDDGWVWSPVDMPKLWNVDRWLTEDPRELERRQAGNSLGQRWYLWDTPMCWVDDGSIAIWGIGVDDEAMVDGVVVYEAEDLDEVISFGGVPKGQLWSNGHRLYAVDPAGLTVWDPFTGERTAEVPGVRPIAFNRWLDELVVIEEGGALGRIRLDPSAQAQPGSSPPAGPRVLP